MNALAPPPALDPTAVGAALHARLRAALPDDVYAAWFGRLEVASLAGDAAVLTLPTRFLVAWIRQHHLEGLRAALDAVAPTIASFTVELRLAASAQSRSAPMAAALTSLPQVSVASVPIVVTRTTGVAVEPLVGSPLDARLTFATFHVGRANRLAHAAALRVAEAAPGDPPLYNPLTLYGAVGLGKTHVAQAVVHAARERGRRAVYLTAERFMFGVVPGSRLQPTLAPEERWRGVDLLVLDDVQFLEGRANRDELGRAVAALLENGGQIVVVADRPPMDLEAFEERLRSRLSGGLCAELGVLDEELRFALLESRVASLRRTTPGFEASPEVIAHVAAAIRGNGRDLDGAVNRLLAYATLAVAPLTVVDAAAAIRDLVRERVVRRIRIEDIQKLVAAQYNVSRGDILSARRTANVVRPRQVAMHLAKVLTLRSLPEIGRRFGGRDHTTVLHAVRKIEDLRTHDPVLADELALLTRMLEDGETS